MAEAETRGFKFTMDEPEKDGGTNTFMHPIEGDIDSDGFTGNNPDVQVGLQDIATLSI